MAAKRTRRSAREPADDLMRRLQSMLYEYHALGRFDEARPHILWLMEIAEQIGRKTPEPEQPTLNS